jgi:hypothetical protein
MFNTQSKRKILNEALWIVAQAKSGSIPVAYGNPGLAKTVSVEAFAKLLGYYYKQFILSQSMPEDAGGNPCPTEVNIGGTVYKCVSNLKQETLLRAMHQETVVHLDEVNQCSPAVMAANQELWFNNPPEKSIVIATANSLEVATDGFQFSAPMINRMCVLDWEFDDDSWLQGMTQGEFPPLEFPVLEGDWSGYKQKWKALVGQFRRQKPNHFDWANVFPKTDAERALPWRSPRSWERGAVCLGAAEAVGAGQDTAKKILSGFVGEGPALEFFSWVESAGFPPSEVLFNNPSMLHLPPQFDTAASLVGGVYCHAARLITKEPENAEENFEKCLDFCEHVFAENREAGTAFVGRFVKLKPLSYKPMRRSHLLWDTIGASRPKQAVTV